MAVAFGAYVTLLPTTTSTVVIPMTVTTSFGSNLALSFKIAISHNSASVTNATWSLGGGAVTVAKAARTTSGFGTACACFVLSYPAPTTGAGTAKAFLSSSVPIQAGLSLFTGANQTTPLTNATATVYSGIAGPNTTLTPGSLTSSDGSDGISANTVSSNQVSVSPNQRYVDSTSNVNAEMGDATGTTGITFNTENVSSANFSKIAVRIAAVAAAAAAGWGRLFGGERNSHIPN